MKIDDAMLRLLAEDAFAVMNWSRREGMKKPQQLDEVVKAFRKRLAETMR